MFQYLQRNVAITPRSVLLYLQTFTAVLDDQATRIRTLEKLVDDQTNRQLPSRHMAEIRTEITSLHEKERLRNVGTFDKAAWKLNYTTVYWSLPQSLCCHLRVNSLQCSFAFVDTLCTE